MRLGFWNRLALVMSIVTTLGVSTLLWSDQRSQQFNAAYAEYNFCVSPTDGTTVNFGECARSRDEALNAVIGWGAWLDTLAVTTAICAAIYCFLWAAVATAKWVWRGRSVANPTP